MSYKPTRKSTSSECRNLFELRAGITSVNALQLQTTKARAHQRTKKWPVLANAHKQIENEAGWDKNGINYDLTTPLQAVHNHWAVTIA